MFRDFSDSAKAKLFDYIDEVTEVPGWGMGIDKISDMGLHIKHWLGFFNITHYVDNLDKYHKKVLDKNNTTKFQIEEIFLNVNNIDIKYAKGFSVEQTTTKKIVKFVNDLSETINPNGGNLNMSKMSQILDTDIEEIMSSKTTTQNIIENKNLGTDPVSTATSIDPVNLATGNFIYEHRDLSFAGEFPLFFHRYYNSKDNRKTSLGKGFRHNFEIFLKENGENLYVVLEDGCHVYFSKEEKVYIGENSIDDVIEKKDNKYLLLRDNGELIVFDCKGRMVRKENQNQVGISLEYSDGLLVKVINDFGDFLRFVYNDRNMLVNVEDSSGRVLTYSYQNDYLISSTCINGRKINYSYSNNGRIEETYSGDEISSVHNDYDKEYRVTYQKFCDGSDMLFEYDDENKTVTQIERNGVKTIFFHDDNYRNTKIQYEDNTVEEYVFNEKGLCIKSTNRMGNIERMSYDNRGNLTQKIDSIKRRHNMTYDENNNLLVASVNGKMVLRNHYDKKGNLVSSEDACGNKNLLNYDSFGRVIMATTPDGGVEEYTYDDRGNISSFKNHFGGVTYYEYDDLHRVVSILNPLKGETKYTYTTDGNIKTEVNEDGNVKQFYYNEKGLLVKTVDYNGAVTKRSYNEINKPKEIIDENGGKTSYKYDSMWNLTEVLQPNGARTFYRYNNENQLSEIEDALGNKTIFKYDLNGNCLSEKRGGVNSKFEYDAVGRKVKIHYLNGSTCAYNYDAYDNLTQMLIEGGIDVRMTYNEANYLIEQKNSEGEIRKFTYTEDGKISSVTDEFGRVTQYTYVPGENKYSSITYPDGKTEKFYYDFAGNLVEYVDRTGNIVSAKYDCMNRLIESYVNEKLMKSISYDQAGNITRIINAEGKTTEYEYSPRNEITKVINAEGNILEYSYDKMGHLLSKTEVVLNEKRTTNYEYDLLDRVIKCIDPIGNEEVFQYDCFNNLIKKKDKDGISVSYEYTKSGKVSKISYDDGRVASLSYNKLDHLQEIKDWTGITRICNDLSGRALSVEYPNGETVKYTYNSAGKRTSIIYPSGKEVEYKYDSLLRLKGVISDENDIKYSYDEFGRLEKKISSTGIKSLYEYNSLGLLESIRNINGDVLLDKVEFEYDVFNRKTNVNRVRSDFKDNNGDFLYSYDDLGRLATVKKDGLLQSLYTYDAYGNRISMIQDGEKTDYGYNELNQLTYMQKGNYIESFEYDKRGNLISVTNEKGHTKRFVYGDINRVEEVVDYTGRKVNYKYNSLGYRVSRNVLDNDILNTENYYIDMTRQYDNLLQLEDDNGSQHFTWDERLVSISDNQNGSYYCLLDELGSPSRLVSDNGVTIETYDYGEFGEEKSKRNVELNPFTFTGYQRDSISQLYFAQAREYMPMAGRFVARDLVAGKVDNINSQNEYLYCEDDPNNFIDKDGLLLISAILIGAAVGAATSVAVNGVKQGIKIAQGKQDSFKIGECLGSAVEGAIVGGVGAIPGAGPVASFALKVGGATAGAIANSTISQGIDDKKIDGGKVAEDAIAGAVFGALSVGIEKGIGAAKTKIFGPKDTAKTTSKTVFSEYKNATVGLDKAQGKYNSIINCGRKPSSLTRKTLASAKQEVSDLKKKYLKTWGKEKAKSFVIGKSGIIRSSARNIFGYKTVKEVGKDSFKKLLPWYSDGEDDIKEYFKDYYGTLYGKCNGLCPIYA